MESLAHTVFNDIHVKACSILVPQHHLINHFLILEMRRSDTPNPYWPPIVALLSDQASAMTQPFQIKVSFCVNAIIKFSIPTISYIHGRSPPLLLAP